MIFKILTSATFLLACCMPPIQCQNEKEQGPILELYNFGIAHGNLRVADNGGKVEEYLGIPYAVPPVGDLRFKKAQELRFKDWKKNIIQADKMPPACPQYSEQPLPWYDLEPGQSEDCLYLNIWVPHGVINDKMFDKRYYRQNKRRVKIYVHDGGWFDGGSNRMPYYDGFGEAVDTIDENGNSKRDGIIVVTVNYRLGALGYLTSGTEDAPGNAAIYDIYEAHDWVRRHCFYFGCDLSSNTTFVGQGSSAIMLSLMRFTTGFFHAVVLNGATFLSLLALKGVDAGGDARFNNLRLTDRLSKALGCGPLNQTEEAIACLRGVDASQLVRVAASLSRGRGPPNVFLPQLYEYSGKITNSYSFMSEQERPYRRKFLATFTKDAGSPLLTAAYPELFGVFGEKNEPLSAEAARNVTKMFLSKFPVTVVDDLLGDLDQAATVSNRDKVVEVLGDAFFNCPMIFFAEKTDAYLLEKQVYPPYNPWASWMGSVGFNNAQIDFLPQGGTFTVNNQTYTYTDEHKKQVRVTHEIMNNYSIAYEGYKSETEYPIPLYTPEDPVYSVLDSSGNLSQEKNYHSRNCDILRPYFQYPNN